MPQQVQNTKILIGGRERFRTTPATLSRCRRTESRRTLGDQRRYSRDTLRRVAFIHRISVPDRCSSSAAWPILLASVGAARTSVGNDRRARGAVGNVWRLSQSRLAPARPGLRPRKPGTGHACDGRPARCSVPLHLEGQATAPVTCERQAFPWVAGLAACGTRLPSVATCGPVLNDNGQTVFDRAVNLRFYGMVVQCAVILTAEGPELVSL
jgi:hypothetical protein